MNISVKFLKLMNKVTNLMLITLFGVVSVGIVSLVLIIMSPTLYNKVLDSFSLTGTVTPIQTQVTDLFDQVNKLTNTSSGKLQKTITDESTNEISFYDSTNWLKNCQWVDKHFDTKDLSLVQVVCGSYTSAKYYTIKLQNIDLSDLDSCSQEKVVSLLDQEFTKASIKVELVGTNIGTIKVEYGTIYNSQNKNLNLELLSKGVGVYRNQGASDLQMKKVSELAQKDKRGIFSECEEK